MNKLIREQKADLRYLRQKAIKLVDELAITQGEIAVLKWRIKQNERSNKRSCNSN